MSKIVKNYWAAPGMESLISSHLKMVEIIRKHTIESYGITLDEFVRKSRKPINVMPRQEFYFLTTQIFLRNKISLIILAEYGGGQNHATILYSIKKIKERIEMYKEYKKYIEKSITELSQKTGIEVSKKIQL